MPDKKPTFIDYMEDKFKPVKKVLNTPIKNHLTRRNANALSAIGAILNRIPTAPTQILGYALQAPDLLYDIKDLTTNPTYASGTEVLLDIPMKFTQLPGYVDDVSSALGIVNDGTGAITGKTVVEHLNTRRKKRHLNEVYEQ